LFWRYKKRKKKGGIKMGKYRTIIIFVGVLFLVSLAKAEVQVKDYDRLKDTAWFKIYMNGVGVGFERVNAYLSEVKRAPLYCQPEKMTLTSEDYLNIIQDSIRKNKDTIKFNYPIEMILLRGLMEKFPCKK
jgi:hypothetical protein